MWCSHKFNSAGLRYEIGVAIQSGDIAWIHGPFPCGNYADLTIYRNDLKSLLEDGERVEADMGYRGEMSIRTPDDFFGIQEWKWQKGRVRARHENVNSRFKKWNILKNVFRHALPKHSQVFKAIAAITQLEITNSGIIYPVAYKIVCPGT